MQEYVARVLADELDVKKSDRILVAVSGGADSVVLLRLLHLIKHPLLVAHCNFQLRGQESEDDETFVRNLCKDLDVELQVQRFETEVFAQEHKFSIQEAARELRYTWFQEIAHDHECKWIATAHHQTDNLETVLINQIRGTGIAGFKGIRSHHNIIRPLIHFSSLEIRDLANERGWEYREDSSNASDKYLRNRIRQNLIPALKEIEPSIEEIVDRNSDQVWQHNELYNYLISKEIDRISDQTKDGLRIPISTIDSYPQPSLMLYNILSKYGFSHHMASQIFISRSSGKTTSSATHAVVTDRNAWLVTPIQETPGPVILKGPGTYLFGDEKLVVSSVHFEQADLTESKNVCWLKSDQTYTIRSWKQGDVIRPLGMKTGTKLVSDVLIDEKIPVPQKRKIPIIAKGDAIVWLAGLCFSEEYKVDENDDVLWRVEIQNA